MMRVRFGFTCPLAAAFALALSACAGIKPLGANQAAPATKPTAKQQATAPSQNAAEMTRSDNASTAEPADKSGTESVESKSPGPLAPADQTAFMRGVDALDRGDFATAETVFSALSERLPLRATVWANLGTARMGGGQEDAALRAYEKAVALDPALGAIHARIGVLYARRGEADKARQAYEKALEVAPGRAVVHVNLGILYERDLGMPGKALEHYRSFQRANGTDDPQVQRWIEQLEQ